MKNNRLLTIGFLTILSVVVSVQAATIAFTTTLVASELGGETCISHPADNVVLIGYRLGTTGFKIQRSTDDGATWTGTIIDASGTALRGDFCSFANVGSTVFATYYDGTTLDRRLSISTNSGSTWTVVGAVDSANDVGQSGGVAMESATRAVMMHHDITNNSMRACRTTTGGATVGAWTCVTAFSTCVGGSGSSVDIHGVTKRAAIKYITNSVYGVVFHTDEATGGMCFAKSSDDGATWTRTFVDAASYVDTPSGGGLGYDWYPESGSRYYATNYAHVGGTHAMEMRWCRSSNSGASWVCQTKSLSGSTSDSGLNGATLARTNATHATVMFTFPTNSAATAVRLVQILITPADGSATFGAVESPISCSTDCASVQHLVYPGNNKIYASYTDGSLTTTRLGVSSIIDAVTTTSSSSSNLNVEDSLKGLAEGLGFVTPGGLFLWGLLLVILVMVGAGFAVGRLTGIGGGAAAAFISGLGMSVANVLLGFWGMWWVIVLVMITGALVATLVVKQYGGKGD